MRDGVELSADIYRPRESRSGQRVPVILSRTPYNKNDARVIRNARYFAEHGYAWVAMDVRGRGDSDGVFVPYRNEAQDGYDSIEWCAAQSWSTGKVGTSGGSYLGSIQWLTALTKPPHLVTMCVMVSPSDPFVEFPQGTHGPQHLCWLYLVSGRLRQAMDEIDWEPIYRHLPLVTMDEQAGFSSPLWREELKHPTRDEFWEPLCYQDKFEQIDLPVLHISGWYDDEQIGTPLNFIGMTARGATEFARTNQKLLMGPWEHNINTSTKSGEVDFGPDSTIDLKARIRRWFDHWLKDQPVEEQHEPRVRLFVMGENTWRDENEYPLARTQYTSYYLHSGGNANSRYGDGGLSPQLPANEPPDRYTYDPERPVAFITAPTSSQIGGADDYAAIQQRGDVLVYLTSPLERDTELTGPVRLILYAATSAADTDFTAMLFDLHPGGFAQRLCDGIVRARFRDGNARMSLIEPHKVYRYEIDLWNTSQVFFKGHRVGIQVTSSAFPKYDRNLNTGEDLGTGAKMLIAEQTLYHDAERASALILPIIPREHKD